MEFDNKAVIIPGRQAGNVNIGWTYEEKEYIKTDPVDNTSLPSAPLEPEISLPLLSSGMLSMK